MVFCNSYTPQTPQDRTGAQADPIGSAQSRHSIAATERTGRRNNSRHNRWPARTDIPGITAASDAADDRHCPSRSPFAISISFYRQNSQGLHRFPTFSGHPCDSYRSTPETCFSQQEKNRDYFPPAIACIFLIACRQSLFKHADVLCLKKK